MKIQCDVCNKGEASVFCTADEAALCDTCDHRVHHANKLASKHQRFSLFHPSSKEFPLCDVCQEKRAFLFCQQDRAILCRDCDVPIHTANEHTKKHNRFLLTGVKLSATSTLFASAVTNGCDSVPDAKSKKSSTTKPVSVTPLNSNPSSHSKISNTVPTIMNNSGNNFTVNESGGTTSSISEYLQMLPGWHVEDLLDSSLDNFGFCKSNDGMLPFTDDDFGCNLSYLSSESNGIWVPQAPTPLHPSLFSSQIGGQISFKGTKEGTSMKINNNRGTDDVFTVPQISPPAAGSKRSRANIC